LCRVCQNRKWREKNKVKYCYQALKDNSKRRGVEFKISLEEFESFCIKTNYIVGKGKTKESYSIDRKESDKGYFLENIQILSLSDNSKKARKTLHYDWENKEAIVSNNLKELNDNMDKYPF
jgi:hypothetical protein